MKKLKKTKYCPNNHYEWEARFAGHRGVYQIYFDTTVTPNTWVINGAAGKLILHGLEHFFEPITEITSVSFGQSQYSVTMFCLDTKQ